MAVTADSVIVELEAKIADYKRKMQEAGDVTDKAMGEVERGTKRGERGVKRLEDQMRSSSTGIGNSLKGLAATFATAFSVRELGQVADSFTRLQNNLRVAGLEGQALADVQGSLLDISQRYGTSLEGLSGVFLKASLAQNELGASTQQIIDLNEIIAASLKVTGTSAGEAQGALLQFGQALGAGVVRAEEFNSILEGALPLAQAAARGIDGFGGSVAKLRAAVADGQITSQQFFEGVLKGGVQTLSDAEKATLTLSGGLEALASSFTVYIGEADKANAVSATIGSALKALGDNLDTLIPAIAIVGTAIGVGYVTNLTKATLATTTLTGASTRLLAVLGGPIGIALTATAVGLAYVATQSTSASERIATVAQSADQAAADADEMEAKLRAAGVAMGYVEDESDGARVGIDGVSNAAETAKGKLYELERQAIRTAVAMVDLQLQENSQRRVGIDRTARSPELNQTRSGAALRANGNPRQAAINAEAAELDREFRELNRKRNAIIAGVRNNVDFSDGGGGGSVATAKPVKTPKGTKGSAGASGPTLAEIEDRFQNERANLMRQYNSALQSMALSADEVAEYELRNVELARIRTLASVEADQDYSRAQKDIVAGLVDEVAMVEREAVEFERRARIEAQTTELADERYRGQLDALRLQFDLADTDAQRRVIAMQILEAEDEFLRSKLDAVIASKTATDVERQRAQIALDNLNATAGARTEAVAMANEGALARYARTAGDVDARIEDITARKIQDINQTIADTMAEQFGIKDEFLSSLLTIFLDKVLFGPLAESLSGGTGGGIGGFFASLLGGAPGRASGGNVRAGQTYMVGERGPELWRAPQSGKIYPTGSLGMAGGKTGNVTIMQTINYDGRNSVTPAGFAEQIARRNDQFATEAARKAYNQSPARISQLQSYGT